MRLVAISDNHSQNLLTKWQWPEGDVLVHAGDLTAVGTEEQVDKMARNLQRLKSVMGYSDVLFVPGNHDKLFANDPSTAMGIMESRDLIALIDDFVVINGIRFYGTPWIQIWPQDLARLNPNLLAFSRIDCREQFSRIPSTTDVLITHQPHSGWFSLATDDTDLGSPQLSSAIQRNLGNMSHSQVYIFGHNHAGHGAARIGGFTIANVALCDEGYKPAFQPTVLDI